MIEYCTPEELQEQLPKVEFGLPYSNADSEDAQADEVAAAEVIIEQSEQGLSLFPELADILTRLEAAYTTDITLQPFVRRGVGMMLNGMQQAHELDAIWQEAERAAISGDWDMREFTGEA